MSALHTTPSRLRTRKSVIRRASPPAGGKPGIVSEMAAQTAKECAVDLAAREVMIAEAAYYRAEKRGFAPGHELDDWLEAEAQFVVTRK